MTVKYFCDCCDCEIDKDNKMPEDLRSLSEKRVYNYHSTRKKPTIHSIFTGSFEGINKTAAADAGDFCKYCVVDSIVDLLDDRPRPD